MREVIPVGIIVEVCVGVHLPNREHSRDLTRLATDGLRDRVIAAADESSVHRFVAAGT